MLKKYELLNMFFQRYSYKNSCFSELVYNCSVLSYKNVLKDLALDLVGSFEGSLHFVYNFGQPYRIQISVLATCTYVRKLSKKISASSSKVVKRVMLRQLANIYTV